MEIRSVKAELFHAEWTDTTKLRVTFRNYANAPNTLSVGLVSASLNEGVFSS